MVFHSTGLVKFKTACSLCIQWWISYMLSKNCSHTYKNTIFPTRRHNFCLNFKKERKGEQFHREPPFCQNIFKNDTKMLSPYAKKFVIVSVSFHFPISRRENIPVKVTVFLHYPESTQNRRFSLLHAHTLL